MEVEDDTPPADRGRKPAKEAVEDPTEDELSSYDEKVQNRIKKFTRGYHDERRAKEQALREREAAEAYAKQIIEENKRLQQQLANGSQKYIETSKSAAQVELEAAKKKMKEAFEAGNADELAAAQEEISKATLKADRASTMKPIEIEDKFVPAPQQPEAPRVSRRTQQWVETNNDWFENSRVLSIRQVLILLVS